MQQAKHIAIIGAGPSGLMAAEILATAGLRVTLYDKMPNPGRKFLMAGRGGLNLTHSELLETFISRYGNAASWLAPSIRAFPPEALRAWCEGLGEATFVGSSGRVFPRSMKAAPLLRAWLKRLTTLGVEYKSQYIWQGADGATLLFTHHGETIRVTPDATLLALGGASWPRLGSDGSWTQLLSKWNVPLAPLRPANCGFNVTWSEHFSTRFAGEPLKSIMLTHQHTAQQGEAMITKDGLEGGVVYAMSKLVRDTIEAQGTALVQIDMRPDMTLEALTHKLQAPRGAKSLASYLRNLRFSPVAISLLRETTPPEQLAQLSSEALAARLKALPVILTSPFPMALAISSAGGIKREALNDDYMLHAKPGIFAVGEMLDWEAPTGGYLLQACFSTAVAAAHGVLRFVR